MPLETLYLSAVFLVISLIIGITVWTIAGLKSKAKTVSKQEYDVLAADFTAVNTELTIAKEKANNLGEKFTETAAALQAKIEENSALKAEQVATITRYANLEQHYKILQEKLSQTETEIQQKISALQTVEKTLVNTQASLAANTTTLQSREQDISQLKAELLAKTEAFNQANQKVAELHAMSQALNEKLTSQKSEIIELKKQFNSEFQTIASQILEEKTHKFTQLNQVNLTSILKPLGENIEQFKRKVEETYDKESKERFSLGKKVEELMQLNHKLSEEANNLTNALKGNSKVRGDWGQMILENILEKSGLAKNREYFVQSFLKDEAGNYLRNEQDSKMQPDVIINCPDGKKVIVDAKVSLIAYARYMESNNQDEQQKAIHEHVEAIKRHINDLNKKSYQDSTDASLDFVMMFIPNEPAYWLASQHEPELWHYAYLKRILLITPANLITVLKVIMDIWQREHQNRNVQEIAKRGAKLYEKFVGFVSNLTAIGESLERAQKNYSDAFKQLTEGRGNLIGQVEELKKLGVKPKKNLPTNLTAALLETTEELPEKDDKLP